MTAQIETAKIHVLNNKGNQVSAPISVMFNPTEYSIARAAATTKKKGSKKQIPSVEEQDLTITLFFDTYEKKIDVRTMTDDIYNLVVPSINGKASTKTPPICKFVWGQFVYLGTVTKVDQKFTMFLSSGIPVRADVTVTFNANLSEKQVKEFSGQSNSRKYWTVQSGDRLELIAQEMLGDPGLWRVIAKENKIHDIISFPTTDMIGVVLKIPDYYEMKGDH